MWRRQKNKSPLRAKVKVVRVLELIQAVKELKSGRCIGKGRNVNLKNWWSW